MADINRFMKKQAKAVFYGEGNPDTPKCPVCGSRMAFHGGDRALGSGCWDCSGCDFTFTEDDLNSIDF